MAGVIRHELGHTLGLSDGYAPVMVDFEFDQHGNYLSGPGAFDSGTILKIIEEEEGIDWDTESGL